MDTFVLNVFIAIIGAMIIPLIPIDYLRTLDTNIGRFVLLSLPVLMYHFIAPDSAVMMGVVVAIIIDRIHDLDPTPANSRSPFSNGSNNRDTHEILLDLSPDYTTEKSNEVVMLEPVEIRRKHGVK
jgi:hypothetical protein